ncbi:MAG: AraC family transcriptional regulator [Clostridiaceae bacterium]|nr:AraC family transcriptional regulator [Clostridiaceae bacterium]
MNKDIKVYNILEQPFYIARQKHDSIYNMQNCHYHNVYEIYYLLDGRRNYFIQNKLYPVVKGDIVLINIHDIHKTMDFNNSFHERILINFQKEFIAPLLDDADNLLDCFLTDHKVIRLSVSEQSFVQSILIKMLEEDRKKQKGYLTYLKILLTELLLFINRNMDKFKEQEMYSNSIQNKMSKVALYLMENYMKKISLKQVADEFFITASHLSRTFKKTTGFTFVEYLNSIRIKEARKLLKETEKSVMEIAELTGFESQTHFGRVFKQMTGVSPLQYRKQPRL